MAAPSVTHTFSNGTTADASQVNTNFTDVINGITDGTKDLSISALTCAGNVAMNGNITLGNGTGDTITYTGRVASDIDPSAGNTYALGDATQTWQALYLDNDSTDGGAIYFDAGSTEFIKANAAGTDLALGGFTAFDLAGAEIKKFALYDVAKSAAYTITDTDGVSVIYVTTSTTDRDITLPTAADNAGRVIAIKKMDDTHGFVTIKGDAAGETVEGVSGTTGWKLQNQYEHITLQCDGADWWALNRSPVRWYFSDDEKTSSPNGASSNAVSVSKSNALGDTAAEIETTDAQNGWGIGHSYAGSYLVTITHNLGIPLNEQNHTIQLWRESSNQLEIHEYYSNNDGSNTVGYYIENCDTNSIALRFWQYRSGTNDWSVYRWRVIIER